MKHLCQIFVKKMVFAINWLQLIKDLTTWALELETTSKYICLNCWAVIPEERGHEQHKKTPSLVKMARAEREKYLAMAKKQDRAIGENVELLRIT